MNYWLLLIPVIGALSAWLLLRVLLTFLFFPVTPGKIAGITIHGLVPRFTSNFPTHVEDFLSTSTNNTPLLHLSADTVNFEKLKPVIESHMEDFLRHRLKQQIPMIGALIGDKTIALLKTVFLAEIESMFPALVQELSKNLDHRMLIQTAIRNAIRSFPTGKLEHKLYTAVKTRLRSVEVAVFAFGFLTGLVQLAIAWFSR